jgi:hypothetical protein
MYYFLYFLAPLAAYLLSLISIIIANLICLPTSLLINYIERGQNWYQFRLDIIIVGLARGFITIFLLIFLSEYLSFELSNGHIIASIIFLSLTNLLAWKSSKPLNYELSLNVPPIFGYILGYFIYDYLPLI